MAKFELKLPKMGESVAEATITSWLKEVGDTIELDEAIVEIATDKVDSEVPSEVEGILVERLYDVDAVVKVGETLAIIEISGNGATEDVTVATSAPEVKTEEPQEVKAIENAIAEVTAVKEAVAAIGDSPSGKFYSPLVKTIAIKENISMTELESIVGTGKDNRVTKDDILAYIENRGNTPANGVETKTIATATPVHSQKPVTPAAPVSVNGQDEIIEMSRMGKLVAQHMVNSVQTSAHVQSFIEVDVTKIVNWRNKVKDSFQKREGEKITFTPIFMEAIAKTIKDFPMINISVDGDRVIKKKNINLGMAAALADGNLIVPVIKNADQLNLMGMTKAVNDLALRARTGKLKPDDTQGGTYTVTNVGSFGSVMGTPIINQPQVAILALGAIRKVPAVIETSEGDFIGIRHKMFLSHSYDHRVVNGALGGMFIQRVAKYLEEFDVNREF
ncbi:2-oxo acid dehydrogenase subunit E2 [Aureibaculum sp. A20]|uniref:Dihydrolipoamide acetyltransferase component of pyruvate dehydrogenase complex n=1 Tax=Aureibaculum flavum TaxID=2795986 RepID=A0ABS0WT20_9FLAO|nr:dihydrolipoamide acetyltransferase family protein [Aureibaculum flavum]MBJ2175130.1 2-oxo acid dehydrogenase subunit E2 [Aureibaculum flavum]